MNKQTIEEKDQLLIKKFRTIVNSKEAKRPPQKPIWRGAPIGLASLCAIIIITGWLVFRDRPDVLVTPLSEHENKGVSVPKEAIQDTISEVNSLESEDQAIDTPQPLMNEETVQTEELEQPQDILTVDSSEPAAPLKQTDQPVVLSGTHISDLVMCSRVINRQFDLPKTTFSLAEGISPVAWMTVMTDHPPLTLTHVYYINGEKYCEVPLDIRYPRTRTWSHVALNQKRHLGKWRVDVMTDAGELLDQIEFSVVP